MHIIYDKREGTEMRKLGLILLFFTFYQLISVIIATQFYWFYRWSHGGVSGGVLNHIHWVVWIVLIIEFIISVTMALRNESK